LLVIPTFVPLSLEIGGFLHCILGRLSCGVRRLGRRRLDVPNDGVEGSAQLTVVNVEVPRDFGDLLLQRRILRRLVGRLSDGLVGTCELPHPWRQEVLLPWFPHDLDFRVDMWDKLEEVRSATKRTYD
jgi:hypothetical protein